jgi:hypothetical protein
VSNEEYKVLLIVILPLTGEFQTRVGITASIEHSSLFRQSVTHPEKKMSLAFSQNEPYLLLKLLRILLQKKQ